jgi:MFS family permease
MVSAFAITRLASGLISGVLVDKFGERAVFSTGICMVSAFTFLAGISQSYEQLLFFRAAGGLGSSMFSVAASCYSKTTLFKVVAYKLTYIRLIIYKQYAYFIFCLCRFVHGRQYINHLQPYY